MRVIDWVFSVVIVVLMVALILQNAVIKGIGEQVAILRGDVLQWSKLNQYSSEFHAVPDSSKCDTSTVGSWRVEW